MNSDKEIRSFKQYKSKDFAMKSILANPGISQVDTYHELFATKFTRFSKQLNQLKNINDKDTVESADLNQLLDQIIDLHLVRKITDNALLGLTTGMGPISSTKQFSLQINALLESPQLLTELGNNLMELLKVYPSLPSISRSQPSSTMKVSNKKVRDIIARISLKK